MRFITALLLSLSLTTIAFAETVYVDDSLRVGVRPEPDNSYSPTSVVVSGMILDVLERKGSYMLIRTPSGVEGWVSNSYVTKKNPAQVLLEELRQQDKVLQETIDVLNARIESLSQSERLLRNKLSDMEQENSDVKEQLNEDSRIAGLLSGSTTPWWSNLIFLILLTITAFYTGIVWFRRHLAKKHGGLSI